VISFYDAFKPFYLFSKLSLAAKTCCPRSECLGSRRRNIYIFAPVRKSPTAAFSDRRSSAENAPWIKFCTRRRVNHPLITKTNRDWAYRASRFSRARILNAPEIYPHTKHASCLRLPVCKRRVLICQRAWGQRASARGGRQNIITADSYYTLCCIQKKKRSRGSVKFRSLPQAHREQRL
jgi:hypothetical protein